MTVHGFPSGCFASPASRIQLSVPCAVARVGGTLLAGLVLLAALALVPARALGDQPLQLAGVQAPAAEKTLSAGLFFRADDKAGQVYEAPLVGSEVEIDLSGEVARVTVRQRFYNPSDAWLEGIYVFPLPENSAVDAMTLVVGDRRIEGEILEKAEAERVYKEAAAEGRRAGLLSGERPNVFVTSLANVGPGQEIMVEIGYQDRARLDAGLYSYRFPMVVAPRYTPGFGGAPLVRAPKPAPPTGPRAQPISHEREEEPLQASPERGRDLFGPVRRPEEGLSNPVALTVRLDAGRPIETLRSLNHAVEVEEPSARLRMVELAEGSVAADRDFVLEWRLAASGAPEAAVFAEEIEGESYLLVSLLPPAAEAAGQTDESLRPPRDLIFVIDTSGSMHGLSIEQAREAVAVALARLDPRDRFNVIRFDNRTEALFHGARPATPDNRRRAQAYVRSLQAEGGTEMRPALKLALDEAPLAGRLRQIVFLTDGAVGNELELFMTIAERLGEARLFTIGIGSAPNSYFMRKAAEVGRGSFTYIGDQREVAARMTALFDKLERPALTDVTLDWPAGLEGEVERYPLRVPDLYQGEPVTFAARLPGVGLSELAGELVLTGRRGDQAWERRVELAGARDAPGAASLWARAKFAEIMDGLTRGRDPLAVRDEAVAVALRHNLVTRFTSLVAVDREVVRPETEDLESREVPRNLPHGMDYGHVFGEPAEVMPLGAPPVPLMRKAAAGGQPIALPQTATPAEVLGVGGLIALLLGLALLIGAGRARCRAA